MSATKRADPGPASGVLRALAPAGNPNVPCSDLPTLRIANQPPGKRWGGRISVAVRDDKAAWVETGRIYEPLAHQAAAFDLRNAFINQPIEVRSLRPQFESWLGLKEERAHLIVRIGRAPLAPYSLRRPLDEAIVNR